MFSGKKFRLWSKHSASKKDAEKESSKDKSKNTSLPKGEDESCRQPNTLQEQSHLQKLQEGYARLEETVEELTPFKTKACALEKKLIYITKSFERKQSRYSTVIASLEVENEQLREEIRRMKSICGSCYFCSRHRMMAAHPEAAKHFHSPRRTDQGSSESLRSSESWRRLQKLEEEQSVIAKETSRQKQETSRCLEQISCEVMKAVVSQKALRKDCTRLQGRILQLEKQNSQLNEVIFRQYPPPLRAKFLKAQRNEVSAYHPQLASMWDEHSLLSTSSLETLKDEEKTASHKLFRIPPDQRFSKEICRPTSDCMSYTYIPQQVMVNSNSLGLMRPNHDHQNAPFHKDISLVDSIPKNTQDSLHYFYCDIKNEGKNEGKNLHKWESSTTSTLTLRDETVNDENDSLTSQHKNSVTRGSTFSLNDILDGDIDELQLSIQSQESTKNNDTTGDTSSISKPGDGKETLQHQNDCLQQNSKTVKFIGDTKDAQIISYSCPSSREQIFKQQKEPTQVPFSRASDDVQSVISFDNCSVGKLNTAAEKRHRYSYPSALSDKSALKSEVLKMSHTQTEMSTGVNMSEPTKALQTDTRQKQDVQKFRLWNFDTFFANSDTEMLGTIKERTVPVTGGQPQIAQHKVRPSGAPAEKAGPEKSANENAKISTQVQVDILEGDISWRTASGGSPEKGSISQESVFGGNTSNKSPAQQNLSHWYVSEGDPLQETPPNGDSSGENPLIGSAPHSNASWTNKWRVNQLEVNPSLAVHTIMQDTANKQDSSPNYCDSHLEQVIWSKERKQEQNDIPAESVDVKVKTEDIIRKRRERFDFISNENSSKDLARDVIISKDKVMALTAYFEEVHAEQCPDCQQSGTRCKISSAYRNASGSKDNSSFEDDSQQVDGNRFKDLEQNQKTKPQDHAVESLKIGEKHELPTTETLTCQLSVSKTLNYEAALDDPSVCDTFIQETPYRTSDNSYISENFTDTGLKVNPYSTVNSSQATDAEIEGTLFDEEMEKANKSEPEQFEHNLISSLGESKLVKQRTENTKDNKNGDLKMCLLGGKNLTKIPNEQLLSKRIQWKSLPSMSPSTPSSHPPFQINYVRTLSLKSFSDALTPPPSPKLNKQNETNKPLGHPRRHSQECSEDIFSFDQTSQEPQHQTQNQTSDRPQRSSQSNTKSYSDHTEKESQGYLQNYAQVHSPGQIQGKQFTAFSEDKSEAQKYHQETHLHPQVHSSHQGQFKVFMQGDSHFCAQNYPLDHLQDDLLFPSHHSPKMNPFPADKEFTTRLQPEKGCLLLSSAKIQSDDGRADQTSCVYPDLVCGSYPRPSICRSQRSNETERKSNVLTEEDIMKYRLDCHNSRTTTGSYPRDLQTNFVSLTAMGSPGYSGDLGMLATKPPLPPRRFHVTKYNVRDGSNPPLDPQDLLNFENEFLGFSPGTPHAEETPAGNEFLPEPNQRTPVWDMDKNCASHSRGVDFNYPAADVQWQGGETNTLALQSATICHSENSKAVTYVSPTQGYQSVGSWQSSGKRNSYPDGSGKTYSQPQAWWDDRGIAVDTTRHHPLERRQTTRPLSSHQTTETVNYSFNNPLYVSAAQRKLPAHCQQIEGESSQTNTKHTESDFAFNEISKQIENLQQTISELQKKSSEN